MSDQSSDTLTYSLDFGEGEIDKLREIQRRSAESIANLEHALQLQSEQIKDIQDFIGSIKNTVDDSLSPINDSIEQLKSFMTETGVARMHGVNREILEQSKELKQNMETMTTQHVEKVSQVIHEINHMAKKSFERFDRANAYVIKNISDAISSFRLTDFQRLTEQSRDIVEETSKKAINRLRDTVRWFHWKNLGLAFVITLFASFTIGLYMSDEMPWEVHKHVVAQRNAGKALMHAWHTLSEEEKELILQHANKAII